MSSAGRKFASLFSSDEEQERCHATPCPSPPSLDIPLSSSSPAHPSFSDVEPISLVAQPLAKPLTTSVKNAWSISDKNERARKRAEREENRVEREMALQQKRQQRIRAAFEGMKSTTLGRRDTVRIVVSQSLFNDRTRSDVLKSLRDYYPNQIFPVSRNMTNLITWRRYNSSCSEVDQFEEVPTCAFIFLAEHYLGHIDRNTLDECARAVKSACLPTHRVVFVISGIDRECRHRTRTIVREGIDSFIVDKRAVQDSYAYLYMEHSIRTHDVRDLDELARYLYIVTEAIAAAPYQQNDDLVAASLSFRRNRALASNRTAVVAVPSTTNTTEEAEGPVDSENEEDNRFGYDPKKASSVRVEGRNDMGNIYLTMLCLIPGVTLKRAQCIRERYPTLCVLLDAYNECSSEHQRHFLLSELRYGDRNRRLGPALSKSVATVLNSLDPNMSV